MFIEHRLHLSHLPIILLITLIDIEIEKKKSYSIYSQLLHFQLDHRQRVNCHHRHLQQYRIVVDIKQRSTTLCNGRVLTLYMTFWLIVVMYRTLRHPPRQLHHYVPQSIITIIITTIIITIIIITTTDLMKTVLLITVITTIIMKTIMIIEYRAVIFTTIIRIWHINSIMLQHFIIIIIIIIQML